MATDYKQMSYQEFMLWHASIMTKILFRNQFSSMKSDLVDHPVFKLEKDDPQTLEELEEIKALRFAKPE